MVNTQDTDSSIDHTPITIIGGGHVGLVQALLLAQSDIPVTCIDANNPQMRADDRTTAISYGSHQVFKSLGFWDALLPHACPIKDIDVMDGASPILLNLNIEEKNNKNAAAFGWVIENHIIRKTLTEAVLNNNDVQYISGKIVEKFEHLDDQIIVTLNNNQEITASLIIGADGRQSMTREWMKVETRQWSYNQKAIVTITHHENPHDDKAVEHFQSKGPFAILPMLDDDEGNHRSSIVWTIENRDKNPAEFEKEIFLKALNAKFPERYGRVLNHQKILSYPLNFSHAYGYIAPRAVLIGDAAHGIHPIAGQGLNLGLRDAATLNEVIKQAYQNNLDIGSKRVLKQYQIERRPDNTAMAATTDMLNRVFSSDMVSAKIGRKIGLKMLNYLPKAKSFFTRQAMGTAGHLPKTMRGKK